MVDIRVKSEGEWSLDSTLPFGPVGFFTNLLKTKFFQQTDWHSIKYNINLSCRGVGRALQRDKAILKI